MKSKSLILLAALGIASLVASSATEAATDRSEGPASDGLTDIIIEGEIASGDEKTFAAHASQVTPKKGVVFLSSPGGNLYASLQIGKMVHALQFATVVTKNQECASGCALIWLGGVPRMAFLESKVGFHAAYTTRDGGAEVTGSGNALVGVYLNSLGLSEAAIAYLASARPNEMNWLNLETARKLGIDIRTLKPDLAKGSASSDAPPARYQLRY